MIFVSSAFLAHTPFVSIFNRRGTSGSRWTPHTRMHACVLGTGACMMHARRRLGERQRTGLPLRRLLLLLAVAVPGAAAPAAPVALHQGVAHVRHRLPGAERDEAYPGVDDVG